MRSSPFAPPGCRLASIVICMLLAAAACPALADDIPTRKSQSQRRQHVALLGMPFALSGTMITDDGTREAGNVAAQLDGLWGLRLTSWLDVGLGLGLSQELKGDRPSLAKVYGYLRPFLARQNGTELGLRILAGVATGVIQSRDATLEPGLFAGLVLDYRMPVRDGLSADLAFEASVASTQFSAPNPGYIRGEAASFTFTPKFGLSWD